ncbi:hypothetical protein ABIB25_003238 [Nakamurella sp. UYEF19]|uniref:hypothetical protein n=1 Tax=Nakamurella sp. UYEF19 TaxID=1756392 RepID=UPI003391EC71
MQTDLEVARALGRYRASWFTILPVMMLGLTWVYLHIDRMVEVFEWADVALLAFWFLILALVLVIPTTIVSTAGIRLVWRRRFIPWTDIDRVYQAGPGDPNVLVGIRGGKPLSIPGVKHDKLPGIIILAGRTSKSRKPGHPMDLLPLPDVRRLISGA